jgi:hypothetical protein
MFKYLHKIKIKKSKDKYSASKLKAYVISGGIFVYGLMCSTLTLFLDELETLSHENCQ